jgi:hypothetical protein
MQTRWLNSLSVLLNNISQQDGWIEVKIYGPEDLEFMQVIHDRVQITMTHLLEDGVFDDKDMCSILASFIFYMEHIGKWFNTLINITFSSDDDRPEEIFTTSEIDTYKSYLNDYLTKYNIEKIIEKDSKSEDNNNNNGKPNQYFNEVENYVKNGLPEEHWFRDAEDIGKTVWLDYDEDTKMHEYDEYDDPKVIEAARFRDGLVSDIYDDEYDNEMDVWANKFKKQSEIVYRYEMAKGEKESKAATKTQKCTDEHHVVVPMGTDNTGIPKGLCQCSLDQVFLMNYHMIHVEGHQSESYLSGKVSRTSTIYCYFIIVLIIICIDI